MVSVSVCESRFGDDLTSLRSGSSSLQNLKCCLLADLVLQAFFRDFVLIQKVFIQEFEAPHAHPATTLGASRQPFYSKSIIGMNVFVSPMLSCVLYLCSLTEPTKMC